MRNILMDGKGSKHAIEGIPWADTWKGPETIIFGHDAVRGIQIKKNADGKIIAVGLDTGACYGGKLSAFVYPEQKVVQQQALKVYETPNIPLTNSDCPE